MSEPAEQSSRDVVRARLIEVAASLLAAEGPDAVTTRSVATAAGVQAPTIYRLFGDKNGLLEAVAEHGFTSYMSQKRPADADADPIDGLRTGWQLHIGFGLANPALFRLMNTAQLSADGRAIAEAGGDVLRQRVRRVAEVGRLRVPESRAVELIRACGTGVVLVLIDQLEQDRDESLAELAWQSVSASILTGSDSDSGPDSHAPSGPVSAAVALRAAVPDLTVLSSSERALLTEWLDRIAR